MKFLLVILAFLLSLGCEITEQQKQETQPNPESTVNNRRTGRLGRMLDEIEYYKDPRTNICFAYSWGGTTDGGPALAAVDCEKIPPELLGK